MRPNHHQFLAFAYVVREGSFSAAAARMGVTQPTITQHISKLESAVGTLLLLRGRDGIKLTRAGQEFYDLADRMVALEAEVSERLEGFNTMRDGQLNVIGNAPQPALRIISQFKERFPDIRVNFGLYSWATATNMIKDRLADVGLITDAPDSDLWEKIYIESRCYVLYCRPNHPLSQRKIVSLKELESETVIIPEKGSLTLKLLQAACDKHQVNLRKTVTMKSFPLMYEAVLQGIGVAVFLSGSSLIKNSISEIPLKEMKQDHQTHLIATKDRFRLKLVSEFINSI